MAGKAQTQAGLVNPYPGYLPTVYPGVGYVSRVPVGSSMPPNIYTQSWFNSRPMATGTGLATGIESDVPGSLGSPNDNMGILRKYFPG